MAYLTQTDQQKKQAQAQAPMATQGPSAAPVGGYAAAAGDGGARPAAAPATKAGGTSGFTNLQTYLNLNKGSGEAMANTIANTANAANAAATNKYNAVANDFRQQTQNGTLAATELRPGDAPDYSDAALANAQAKASQGYTGPVWGSVQNQQYAPQAAEAAKQAGRLGSQEGLGLSLNDAYGKGKAYSTSARGLDAFLTSSAGADKLKQASSGYDALAKYLGGAQTRGNEMEATGRQNTADAQAGWAQQASDIQAAQYADHQRQLAEAGSADPFDPRSTNTRLNRGDVDRPRDSGQHRPRSNVAWISGGGRP